MSRQTPRSADLDWYACEIQAAVALNLRYVRDWLIIRLSEFFGGALCQGEGIKIGAPNIEWLDWIKTFISRKNLIGLLRRP